MAVSPRLSKPMPNQFAGHSLRSGFLTSASARRPTRVAHAAAAFSCDLACLSSWQARVIPILGHFV
jgi:hypothetical protein